jgi:hypothetical protein
MQNKSKIGRLAVFILMVSLALAACQSPGAAAVSTQATASTPAATVPGPTPDAQQAQDAIIKALLALSSHANRMDVTTALKGGQTDKSQIEFIPPDRKHITGGGAEYIVVGDKVYAKMSDSAGWQQTQISATTFIGDKPTPESIGKTIGRPQFVGADVLDGKPALVYRYVSTTTSGGVQLHDETKLWVSQKDGLPLKIVADGDALSVVTDPSTGVGKTQAVSAETTTLIHFDPSLKIEAPPLQ